MRGPNYLVKNAADSHGKSKPRHMVVLAAVLGGAVLVSSIASAPPAGPAMNQSQNPVGKGQKSPGREELHKLSENIRQQLETAGRIARMKSAGLLLPPVSCENTNAGLFQSLQTLNDIMRPYVIKEYITIPADPTVMLTTGKLDSIKIEIDRAFVLYPMLVEEAAGTTAAGVRQAVSTPDTARLNAQVQVIPVARNAVPEPAAARDSISFASALDTAQEAAPPSAIPETAATPQAQKPLAIAEAIAAKALISPVQKPTTITAAAKTAALQQMTPAEREKYRFICKSLGTINRAKAGTARTRYLTDAVKVTARRLLRRMSDELMIYSNAISQPGAIETGTHAGMMLNYLRAHANKFNKNTALQNALREIREVPLKEAAAAAKAAPKDPLLKELLILSAKLNGILADPTLKGRFAAQDSIEDVKAGANAILNSLPDVWKLPGEKPEGKEISPRLEMYVALSTAATALAEGKLEEAKQRYHKDTASSALAIFRREMALSAQRTGNPAKSPQKEALKKL